MKANQFSRTAQAMAFFRALETARGGTGRLLKDTFPKTVLPVAGQGVVTLSRLPLLGRGISAVVDSWWPGARTSGVARTRLIDDWVSAAVGDGATQVVILGAGFDSRAWRLAALAGIPVYEIDHPATSMEKRRRLVAAGLTHRGLRRWRSTSIATRLQTLLEREGFDGRRHSFVIWEGVTNYLTEDAVDAVLRWASSLATGSRLAFTYVHARVLEDPATFEGAERVLASVAKAGEAWTYGIDPAGLQDRLAAHGLKFLEDLGADDYRARYCGPRDAQARGYAFYRAALASVPAMPKLSATRTAARRRQILDAAIVCFAERGFHKSTLQDVVRISGLSPGSIYSHFASKDEIIHAVIEGATATTFVMSSCSQYRQPGGRPPAARQCSISNSTPQKKTVRGEGSLCNYGPKPPRRETPAGGSRWGRQATCGLGRPSAPSAETRGVVAASGTQIDGARVDRGIPGGRAATNLG